MRVLLPRCLAKIFVATLLLPLFSGCQTTRQKMSQLPGLGWAAPRDQMDFDELDSDYELTPPSAQAQPRTNGLADSGAKNNGSYPDTGYPSPYDNLSTRTPKNQGYDNNYTRGAGNSYGDAGDSGSYADTARRSLGKYRDSTNDVADNYRRQASNQTKNAYDYSQNLADRAQNTVDNYSNRTRDTYDNASKYVEDKANDAIDGVDKLRNGAVNRYDQAVDAAGNVRDQAAKTYGNWADTANDTYQQFGGTAQDDPQANDGKQSYDTNSQKTNDVAEQYRDWSDDPGYVNNNQDTYESNGYGSQTDGADAPKQRDVNQRLDVDPGYQSEVSEQTDLNARPQRDYGQPWRPGSTSSYSPS